MPQIPRGFYPDFRDSVEAHRQTRGAARASWDDVWIAAAETHVTSKVLSDQGVYSDTLARDVRFSMVFGRPAHSGIAENGFLNVGAIHNEASTELLSDVRDYVESLRTQGNETGMRYGREFAGQLRRYLFRRERLLSDPENLRREQEKVGIIEISVKGFLSQMGQDRGENGGRDPNAFRDEMEMRARREVMQNFLDYLALKSALVVNAEDPLPILDQENKTAVMTGSGGMTAFKLVETAKAVADPFLQYALHRSGLPAPIDYEAPYRMPHVIVTNTALDAYTYVKDRRETKVSPKHLVPSLLGDPEVRSVIRELDKENKITGQDKNDDEFDFILGMGLGRKARNGPNFIKFTDAIRRAISPPDNSEERFFHHPIIDEDLKAFLYSVSEIVAKGPEELARARMFGELLKFAEVQDVLVQAGMTKSQLGKWSRTLGTIEKKLKEDQKVGDKRKEPFKVDQRELDQLLEKYASDRTKLALDGKLDPIIGRKDELRQIIQILLQRGRANPLLLGEPGVGKTALFDGLAHVIASGRIPKELVGAKVYTLNLHAMNSGAMYRGQFEGRLLPIIEGVAERNAQRDKAPIILCIDELHSAVKAGTAAGTDGAGEILKPPLTEGNLIVVGATTQKDFAEHIEPDQALTRRFQSIFVQEPPPAEAKQILSGLAAIYSKHHRIEIPDHAIPLIVDLTGRYLPIDMQPDKAITALDEACTRARMAGRSILTNDDIIDTIGAKAKIDPTFLKTDDGVRFLRLRKRLPQRVLGQNEATTAVAEALIAAKADLRDPNQPLGRFLFLGPTGVGKTELARALAMLLHGTEDALIKIDMTDYKEPHTASRLVGAPPGYVGHGQEGELTGSVRRRPHSVVLLDEVEKAHPEVFDTFMPILEDGEIRDARGQRTTFRNAVVIMTSNIGSRDAFRAALGFGGRGGDEATLREKRREIYEDALKDFFRPELLNRLDGWFIFDPLDKDTIRKLVRREIGIISSRLRDRWGLSPLTVDKTVMDQLVTEGYKSEYGARHLKRTVQQRLATPLATWLLGQDGKLPSSGSIKIEGLPPEFEVTVK